MNLKNYYTRRTSIQDDKEFNPTWQQGIKTGEYEKAWFCDTDKVIHRRLKERLNCLKCTPLWVREQYEAQQRMKAILNK